MKTTESTEGDEKEVILRLKDSDEVAFNFLFRTYGRKIYYFAIQYLKCTEEAEEIVQEAFIKIWETRLTIDPAQSFSGFLFTITHRLVLNRIRKIKNEINGKTRYLFNKEYSADLTEQQVLVAELEAAQQNAFNKLPPRRKTIYRMVKEDGLTYKEVAAQLNISVKTVESQMGEAVKYLRRKLSL